jgi:hypothetical protein
MYDIMWASDKCFQQLQETKVNKKTHQKCGEYVANDKRSDRNGSRKFEL